MRIRIGIVLVLLVLVAAACGDSEGDGVTTLAGESCAVEDLNLVEAGFLTIATGEPVFPPWMIDDDPTNKQGFEGAVAYAVAAELGFTDDQVKWVRTGFDEAIVAGPKGFDFNIQQYSIKPERDQVVDFSDGYYTVKQAVIAFAGSDLESAETTADLRDFKLGAAIGTTSLDYIEDVIQPTEAAAVYDTYADAKAAFDAGQLEGLVADTPTAFYITAVEIPEATIVGELQQPGDQPEEFGLLFEEGNSLVGCVNQAIAALKADGTLAALEVEWLAGIGEFKQIAP